MSFLPQAPPPSGLDDARRSLSSYRTELDAFNVAIEGEESRLAELIQETQRKIAQMKQQRAECEQKITETLAYLSPLRRLPQELLRYTFLLLWKDNPCCGWTLASVSSGWRRLALSTPQLWRKIRLVTSPLASPDTVRLWLERSGSSVPLDIEIYLKVPNKGRTRSSQPLTPPWTFTTTTLLQPATIVPPAPPPPTHPLGVPPPYTAIPAIHIVPAAQAMLGGPPTPPQDPWGLPDEGPNWRGLLNPKGAAAQWGHVAVYYLVQQMHRWERFVFRCDKQFSSMSALKAIMGDAPMLREFEISCAEPGYYCDWSWLPSAKPNTTMHLPELTSLTLQHVPFKWSSPLLYRPLTSLTLRSLPNIHLSVDRLLHVVHSIPTLVSLSAHFAMLGPAVLPLFPCTLSALRELNLGGHHLLAHFLDTLTLPALTSLILDVEAHEPIEELIAALLQRSSHPPINELALAYALGAAAGGGPAIYYAGGGAVTSWAFLSDLTHLRTLSVGGAPFDPLLSALGPPEDEGSPLPCPDLTTLRLRGCHAHGEGIARLVQMVEARNAGAPGTGTQKVRTLELAQCQPLGQDVMDWLNSHVEDVICTEIHEDSRPPRSPTFVAW